MYLPAKAEEIRKGAVNDDGILSTPEYRYRIGYN